MEPPEHDTTPHDGSPPDPTAEAGNAPSAPSHESRSSPESLAEDDDMPALDSVTSKSPRLSRNPSVSGSSSYHDDWDPHTPLDRLTMLDLLDNFTLPLQLEKLQKGITAQTDKVRRQRDAFKSKSQEARDRMVEEWRRRLPSADEQLERYRKNMKRSMEKLSGRWNDTKVITLREKVSFICGVMNIFISGFLLGGYAEYFHLWYTAQLLYFMPIRFFTYHRRGYHYFLADLCYFSNLLLFLSLWIFPASKRLFMAAYCLSFGNNAVAIIMWRNSLVFHSFDKVTSLFIHIMPCATLHCIVHLYPAAEQAVRFPAVFNIKNSTPGSSAAYGNLVSMLGWSSLPYAMWQLVYYVFITVRRRDKIAAGRPTSFTWLRKSYSKTWLGKIVLSLPNALQEPAFMLIQYSYSITTMIPCPIWFYSRAASAAFLMVVFTWSVYNGSTYYIDVFGKRFQKELESMKAEVTKWQNSAEMLAASPSLGPSNDSGTLETSPADASKEKGNSADDDVSGIPLLNDEVAFKNGSSTALEGESKGGTRGRKTQES